MNRETWLQRAIKRLDTKYFAGNGYELPEKLAVSCGFPLGSSTAIGQCWDPSVSSDGTTEMFISPSLGDPVKVLVTLLHEMIHAAVGIHAGHRGPFKKLAVQFGMGGKMTATSAVEGTDLFNELTVIAEKIGEWPHAAINKKASRVKGKGEGEGEGEGETASKGKGGSGWVRLVSPTEPSYTVVISPKKAEEFGVPSDPWGNKMVPKK